LPSAGEISDLDEKYRSRRSKKPKRDESPVCPTALACAGPHTWRQGHWTGSTGSGTPESISLMPGAGRTILAKEHFVFVLIIRSAFGGRGGHGLSIGHL